MTHYDDCNVFNAGSSIYDLNKSEEGNRGLCQGGQETQRLDSVGSPGNIHAGKDNICILKSVDKLCLCHTVVCI